MIDWIKIDASSSLYTRGSPSITQAELDALRADPSTAIRRYGHQVGRQMENSQARIYCWAPYLQIFLDDSLVTRRASSTESSARQQFWEAIPRQMNAIQTLIHESSTPEDSEVLPYLGFYGYLSYELSRYLDQYDHRDDTLPYPYLVLDFPTRIYIESDSVSYYIELDLPPISDPHLESISAIKEEDILVHRTSYEEYIGDLRSILDHIRRGDIYQANYTQGFDLQSSRDPLDLYQSIKAEQNLPHAAFLNYGGLQMMSLSPELFLQIADGQVVTKPIKGTRPRGSTPQEDAALVEELISSRKDQAELAMIVDLLRNDLGKSAHAGSVKVKDHAVVETYENVHHLVSAIQATIDPTIQASWNLLLRAFPGGSISGVPKIRALEIIEAHESYARGIYTGTIGYLGLDGGLELNIAIRTAVISGKAVTFNAGGGIVYDSDPVEEYIESLHKAKHLANYFDHSFVGHLVFLDGQYLPQEMVTVQPQPPGIFETILVEDGQVRRLESHLSRLEEGLAYQELDLVPPTPEELDLFLRLNITGSGLFRLNIYAWADPAGQESHLLMKIQNYSRQPGPYSLLLAKSSVSVPGSVVAGLKSLDYQIYRDATRLAQAHHCWDSLQYTNNATLLEGGRSTIFCYFNDRWYTPRTKVVNGIIRQYLIEKGLVKPINLSLDDLDHYQAIAVGNALIGIELVDKIQTPAGDVIWTSRREDVIDLLRSALND